MKSFRLINLAVILLALLSVSSAMGGTESGFFSSGSQSDMCLSLRERKKMAACCNPNDALQEINISVTSPTEGVFHSRDGMRMLCFEHGKDRFRILKRNKFPFLMRNCTEEKVRHGRKGRGKGCTFSDEQVKSLMKLKRKSKVYQCVLHRQRSEAGYNYISVDKRSVDEGGKYLALRGGKVRKTTNREEDRQFIILTKKRLSRFQKKCIP